MVTEGNAADAAHSADGNGAAAGTGSADGSGAAGSGYPFRYAEQYRPPAPQRVTDVAVTTFEHLFEVDPRLMQTWVWQQQFPNWDSLRIMHARHEHLEWMHRHFADSVIDGSSVLAELEAEDATAAPPAGSPSGDSSSTGAFVWTRPETD